jgi:hypothetical protein
MMEKEAARMAQVSAKPAAKSSAALVDRDGSDGGLLYPLRTVLI